MTEELQRYLDEQSVRQLVPYALKTQWMSAHFTFDGLTHSEWSRKRCKTANANMHEMLVLRHTEDANVVEIHSQKVLIRNNTSIWK